MENEIAEPAAAVVVARRSIYGVLGRYNELITTYRVCESTDTGISSGSREYSTRRALS